MYEDLQLPSEVMNPANYPGLYLQKANIQALVTFATSVASDIDAYTAGTQDSLTSDPGTINSYIEQFRAMLVTLSALPQVPYDTIISLRSMQAMLQNVYFILTTQGGVNAWQPAASPASSGI